MGNGTESGAKMCLATMPLVVSTIWELYFSSVIKAKVEYKTCRFMNCVGAVIILCGSWATLPLINAAFGGSNFGNYVTAYGAAIFSISSFWSTIACANEGNGPHNVAVRHILIGVGMALTATSKVLNVVPFTRETDIIIILNGLSCSCYLLMASISVLSWLITVFY